VKVPQIRILNLHWGSPVGSKVYKEVGMVMTEVLPYIYEVKSADDEGAVLYILVGEDQEEEIKELREHLLYVDMWFEGEDQEKVREERIMRWAKKKLRRKEE